jgi:hypothetical protein
MKNLNELLELRKAIQVQLCDIEEQISAYEDGYTYWVNIRSYGSSTWEQIKNIQSIRDLVEEYSDGYDGIVCIYTDRTDLYNMLADIDYGCGRYHTLDELPKGIKGE